MVACIRVPRTDHLALPLERFAAHDLCLVQPTLGFWSTTIRLLINRCVEGCLPPRNSRNSRCVASGDHAARARPCLGSLYHRYPRPIALLFRHSFSFSMANNPRPLIYSCAETPSLLWQPYKPRRIRCVIAKHGNPTASAFISVPPSVLLAWGAHVPAFQAADVVLWPLKLLMWSALAPALCAI